MHERDRGLNHVTAGRLYVSQRKFVLSLPVIQMVSAFLLRRVS